MANESFASERIVFRTCRIPSLSLSYFRAYRVPNASYSAAARVVGPDLSPSQSSRSAVPSCPGVATHKPLSTILRM